MNAAKETPWESGLNPEQRKAVEQTEGPALILAGAGSGKTKTLTHRIAYLLMEKKVAPQHILAVTFTNKAAAEMRERVEKLLVNAGARGVERLVIGTFHSVCVRILRQDIEVLGQHSRSFNIYDADDQQTLIKQTLKQLDISAEEVRPRAVADVISKAKNKLQSAEEFAREAEGYYEEIVAKVYSVYQTELIRANALDFDDLIFQTVKIFQTHPEVLEKYQKHFQYILVDEYQDTNHSQYLLVTSLAAKSKNLFVIGDDYQSIYGWRQANIQNILNFEKDYPDARVVTLAQNYRSTQNILDAAQGVIDNNSSQRKKELWTEGDAGEKITRVVAPSEAEEAHFVVKSAKTHLKENELQTVAVLYRTNAQSRILEEACLRENLAYKIIGGIRFYERREVKDMISLVRFYQNPKDTLALERIIKALKLGIGKATFDRWQETVRQVGGSYEDALDFPETLRASGLTESKIKTIRGFVDILRGLRSEVSSRQDMTLPVFLERLARLTKYIETLEDGTQEGEDRAANVRELFSVATKFVQEDLVTALERFLEEVALVSDADSVEQKSSQIEMMTIHSAKGLEFDVVFIIGLEEGIFPHSRSAFSASELEEERRLMYVALTRAKKKAYLISTEERVIFGSVQYNPPSRFLEEIPEELCEDTVVERKNNFFMQKRASQHYHPYKTRPKTFLTKPPVVTLPVEKNTPGEIPELRPGDMVEHAQFGRGLVMALDGKLVTVAFKEKGVKKMMLGVAPLEKL